MRAMTVLIGLAVMAQAALYAALGAVERPTTAIEPDSCVTADCHVDVTRHRVLHGPVNVHECDACHVPVDVHEHTFRLTHEPGELCASCHTLDIPADHHVHEPIETGDCTGCHDPHGGMDRRFVKPNAFGQACFNCHEPLEFQSHANVHGPVAAGECSGCHGAHSAPHEKLLLETGSDMCISCHQQMGRQMFASAVVHEPAGEDCLSCHDPHASNYTMMTKAPTARLCTDGCHQDVRETAFRSTFPHAAAVEDAACSNCHTPHGSNRSALLLDRPLELCLSCHDHALEREGRAPVAAVPELISPDLHQHGPVQDGNCAGCHDVHGSNVHNLLAGDYPDRLYEPFDVESYGLCFSCHASEIVLEPRIEGLTRFRDGDTNLHYVHVNQMKRGRTCRTCHDVHSAASPQLVHESITYGAVQWQLPINFERTDTGGSCTPGCHQPLHYDRVQPVNDRADPLPGADDAPPGPADDRASSNPPAADSRSLDRKGLP